MRPVWSTALRRTLMGSMGAVLHLRRRICLRFTFGLVPKLPERGGNPVGLRLVGRVEVMQFLEHLTPEVRKEATEPLLHRGPPRMRSRPVAEVNRRSEPGVLGRLDPVPAQ